jgi:hypothetical protein
LLSQSAQAEDIPGLMFSHKDWEISCDNTRTCRAAGYQADDRDESVSVLLTRRAGPRQPVTGQLKIGDYSERESLKKLSPVFILTMKVNGRDLGKALINQDSLVADLSTKQVAALIAALARNSTIEWMVGENIWQLSDQGAAAILLKMDEFQGRIGTSGALVKKGSLGEDSVLPALPMPVVIAAPLAKPQAGDNLLPSDALRNALQATITIDDGECFELSGSESGESELSIIRLSKTKLLVSTLCWRAAYNSGDGYWVINDSPPYNPVLVTTSGTDYNDDGISEAQKGRGLGDCWSHEGWTWDGKEFIHTESSTTGMCKLVAAGGTWTLPTIVSEVRHSPR